MVALLVLDAVIVLLCVTNLVLNIHIVRSLP